MQERPSVVNIALLPDPAAAMMIVEMTRKIINTNSLLDTPCRAAGSIYRLLPLIAAGAVVMLSCATMEHKGGIRHPAGWYASVDALTAEIIDAIAAGDAKRLAAASITEQEYAAYVWPHLPIAKIEQWQSQRDFVWQQHQIRNLNGLESMLSRYGWRKLAVISVSFREKPVHYGTCIVHPKALITVRDESGQEDQARLYSSLVEINGLYKVFSYAVD